MFNLKQAILVVALKAFVLATSLVMFGLVGSGVVYAWELLYSNLGGVKLALAIGILYSIVVILHWKTYTDYDELRKTWRNSTNDPT